MNFIELIQRQAEQVFGNKEKAQAWLSQPKSAFGDSSALQAAQTEAGYKVVKAELERIDHGYTS